MARNEQTRFDCRLALLSMTMLASLSACESGTVELVRDIDAARGDCTVDGLRASTEECVQMFERYAEMGTGAMNTYVGAMRAMDEALRRNGGLGIDTAGLGRAFTPGFGSGDPDWAGGFYADQRGTVPSAGSGRPGPDYGGAGPAGGGWVVDSGYDAHLYPAIPPANGVDPRASSASGAFSGGGREGYGGDPAVVRRGVLLPPESRLRRPWLEDDLRETAIDSRDWRGLQGPGGAAMPWGSPGPGVAPYGYPGPYPPTQYPPTQYPPANSPYGYPGDYPVPQGHSRY